MRTPYSRPCSGAGELCGSVYRPVEIALSADAVLTATPPQTRVVWTVSNRPQNGAGVLSLASKTQEEAL